MKYCIPFLLVAAFSSYKCLAQEEKDTKPKNEIVILAGPTYGKIINDNVKSDKYATSNGTVGINAGLNYNRYINTYFAVGFGAEYNRISTTTWYKGGGRGNVLMSDSYTNWHYLVVASDYYEKVIINQLDIPLKLTVQTPIVSNVYFFADAGVKFNVSVASRFIQKGTLTTSGAFPFAQDGYTLLENQPQIHFETKELNSDKDWDINPVNFSFIVSGGFKIKLNEKTTIMLAPGYMLGLNDITSGGNKSDYVNIYGDKTAYKPTKLKQYYLRFGVGFMF